MAQANEPKISTRVDLSPSIYKALEREAVKRKITKRTIFEAALCTYLNLPVKEATA